MFQIIDTYISAKNMMFLIWFSVLIITKKSGRLFDHSQNVLNYVYIYFFKKRLLLEKDKLSKINDFEYKVLTFK